LLRNDVMKMIDDLTCIVAGCNNIVRELGSKQDCLVDKVLSLRNNATQLADDLERVAGRPG
jgi:hypothetical protein